MDARVIKVTVAAHNHGNLNLRPCGRNFFPKESFGKPSRREGIGEQITILAEGFKNPIRTDIPTDRKTGRVRWLFREREWVKDFVNLHELVPGDWITIKRIDRRSYSLIPCTKINGKKADILNGRSGKASKPPKNHKLQNESVTRGEKPEADTVGASVERGGLLHRYEDTLVRNPALSRSLVSFQANKNESFYGWFRFKECFSKQFVRYCLDSFRPLRKRKARLLDPFAGIGTALLAGAEAGWFCTGIEVLPVGVATINARTSAATLKVEEFAKEHRRYRDVFRYLPKSSGYAFPHLRITEHAFPAETERAIGRYMAFVSEVKDKKLREVLRFAALSILEEVSYTRKDGQYLRWDTRASRKLKSEFEKGRIYSFDEAIERKLDTIESDLSTIRCGDISDKVDVIHGSCLEQLPLLPVSKYDLVITSPPYCNRYDYTRTYALELAFLGQTDATIRHLRQSLLSATVENRSKINDLRYHFNKIRQAALFDRAQDAYSSQKALREVLDILESARDNKELNNPNIPNMIANYFFEMSVVIHCLGRVLTGGGRVVMVNDNVQYHGQEIPVDLILSEFARSAGMKTEAIWVLPRGKGNSSQQMGVHGRNEIRKCVYIWKKQKS